MNHWQSHCNAESIFLETFAVALSMKLPPIFNDNPPHCEVSVDNRFCALRASRLFIPGILETLSNVSTLAN